MNYNKMVKIGRWIADYSESPIDEIVWLLEHLSQDKLKSIADTLKDELELLEGEPNDN